MRQTVRMRSVRRGFTIIELVVVIAIIGLLMGAAAFALPQILGGARVDTTKNNMRMIEQALTLYHTQNGTYPENGNIMALVAPSGSLSKASAVEDGWGNQIQLYAPSEYNGQPVDWLLQSYGPNGVDDGGGGDDIVMAQGYEPVGG